MNKPTLYYIYDALCGWCYGFGPVVTKLQENYADQLHFEVLSGGMITGSRVAPIAHMAAYIKQASPRVTELTGVVFGEAYLDGLLTSSYISNSLPPAVALSILKEAKPEQQVAWAHGIQQLMFREGQDLNEVAVYFSLAAQAGLTESGFQQKFADPAYRARAEADFYTVQQWGITGFPAVVLEQGEQLYLLARGYTPYPALTEAIAQVITTQ